MGASTQLVRDYTGADDTNLDMVAADGSVSKNSGGDARSDTLRLRQEGQGFHANADGTINLVSPAGRSKVFVVTAGSYYPYRFTQILATDTSLAPDEIGILLLPY